MMDQLGTLYRYNLHTAASLISKFHLIRHQSDLQHDYS